MNVEQLANQIDTDPITGEVIDPKNADQLIESLLRISGRMDALKIWKGRFEDAIAALAKNENKTERVAGSNHVAKVEWPGKEFDSASLKRLWEKWPQYRESYLRIESVAVQKREYDKLTRTSGTAELERFKAELMSHERESVRRPYIKIES